MPAARRRGAVPDRRGRRRRRGHRARPESRRPAPLPVADQDRTQPNDKRRETMMLQMPNRGSLLISGPRFVTASKTLVGAVATLALAFGLALPATAAADQVVGWGPGVRTVVDTGDKNYANHSQWV